MNSYTVVFKDIREIDLYEVITWKYKDHSYKNTKKELYKFFSDTSWFSSHLGLNAGVLSQNWLTQTFGDTYWEWAEGIAYSHDAERLLVKYFLKTGQVKISSNVILTPDFEYKVKTGMVNSLDGTTKFEAYDKNGDFLGSYSDGDDKNLVIARIEHKQELPPKISDGWISTDLLDKIFSFEIKIDNNDVVFQTDPSVTKYNEFLRLKLPDGWLTDDNIEAKVSGVSLRKYIIKENEFESEWIARNTLDKQYGIYCSIGDTIDEFRFYAPYNSKAKNRLILFKGMWPVKWQESDNQNVINVSELRIKREDCMDYFNVEDLEILKVLPEPEKTIVIYLNINDLQNIGLIK